MTFSENDQQGDAPPDMFKLLSKPNNITSLIYQPFQPTSDYSHSDCSYVFELR